MVVLGAYMCFLETELTMPTKWSTRQLDVANAPTPLGDGDAGGAVAG
jgi:hypothetical protein